MYIEINDYEKAYSIDVDVNNEMKKKIRHIISKTFEDIDNRDFKVYVFNMSNNYGSHEVGVPGESLYIFNNYSNSKADIENPSNEEYGEMLKYVGDGLLFKDEEGNIIAEYREDNTYNNTATLNILFDLFGQRRYYLFEKILSDLNIKVFTQLANRDSWIKTNDKNRLLEILEEQVQHQKNRDIIRLKGDIERIEDDIQITKSSLTRYIKQLESDFKKLEGLTNSNDSSIDKIKNDLDLIAGIDKVKDIRIKDNKLIILTNILYIHDETGRRFYGGEYTIKIDINQSDVRFFNDEGRKSYWTNNDPHPHISGHNGSPCWGNLTSTIVELCTQGELYALVLQCIDFLENVDIHEWAGGHVVNWDLVDEEGNRLDPPNEMDPTEEEESEASEYCESCEEYHHEDDMHTVYDYIEVINDGEDVDYGDIVRMCHECFDHEAFYVDEAEEYTLEVEHTYQESDNYHSCTGCTDIRHGDDMYEVYDYIKIDEQGRVKEVGSIDEFVCINCLSAYEEYHDDSDGITYYANEMYFTPTEDDLYA